MGFGGNFPSSQSGMSERSGTVSMSRQMMLSWSMFKLPSKLAVENVESACPTLNLAVAQEVGGAHPDRGVHARKERHPFERQRDAGGDVEVGGRIRVDTGTS